MKTPSDSLGEKFLIHSSAIVGAEVFEKVKLIGLYFGANWCPACIFFIMLSKNNLGKLFTPILSDFYQQVNATEKQFEVIYVPLDNSESECEAHRKKMPWPIIPFNDPRIEVLTTRHSIDEIPQLIILRADGTVLLDEAKSDIKLKGSAAFDEWLSKK